jgi:serine/threonine-protein kinase HipA
MRHQSGCYGNAKATIVKELVVLLEGLEVGIARQVRGKLTFSYNETWRASRDSYPLSLSMPLTARDHPHSAIEPFIWGLLPDNDQVLRSWAQKFQTSPRNAFDLIGYVGEDCAGAVQFVKPENLELILSGELLEPDWLSEAQMAERLRIVRDDASAGRMPNDLGQFSLAGAQPKTALFFDGQRWGVTSGKTPTTHILKPTTREYQGHAENEHLCLRLAAALGLTTAKSWVAYFEDVPTIVVERYDTLILADASKKRKANAEELVLEAARTRSIGNSENITAALLLEAEAKEDFRLAKKLFDASKAKPAGRIHQEDFCQALSVHPALKYQNQGGPGAKDIIEVIKANVSNTSTMKSSPKLPFASSDDFETFLQALIFNWLIGGTDAHAKNYSLMLGRNGMVRLAPVYDIASILAYPHIDPRKAKMAMKIGERYGLMDISFSDWLKFAISNRLDGESLIEQIRKMSRELPDRLSDEINVMRCSGLNHIVMDVLAAALPARATRVAKL